MNIKEYLYLREDTFTFEFRELYIYYNNGETTAINLKTRERFINPELIEQTSISERFNLNAIFPEYYNHTQRDDYNITLIGKVNGRREYKESWCRESIFHMPAFNIFWYTKCIDESNLFRSIGKKEFKINNYPNIIYLDDTLKMYN